MITCFLPCRQGSERIPRKNIKPFAGLEFGLISLKLEQLSNVKEINEIVLSTNDIEILDYVSTLSLTKLRVHKRDESLSSSMTSTDTLISHAFDLIPEGDILWTHVTSPFITSNHYSDIIDVYKKKIKHGYDSLMTVTLLHSYLWQNSKPINYERKIERWPRTQMLEPIHEINSGVFLASNRIYQDFGDRIGSNPYLYVVDKLVGHDIDWPEDFIIAECIASKGLVDL